MNAFESGASSSRLDVFDQLGRQVLGDINRDQVDRARLIASSELLKQKLP